MPCLKFINNYCFLSIQSHGKRHSSSRRSINATRSTGSQEEERVANKDPLMETTLLTTYTDFKVINTL